LAHHTSRTSGLEYFRLGKSAFLNKICFISYFCVMLNAGVPAMDLFSPRQRHSERLTSDQEKDMARKIRRAEQRAREAIEGIGLAQEILSKKPERAERTRAGMVDRLEGAVEAAWKASKEDPGLRADARRAKGAWAEAEGLRWKLAMSGRRIAHGEARKLAGPFMDE
jgi:hypothetical protein